MILYGLDTLLLLWFQDWYCHVVRFGYILHGAIRRLLLADRLC